VNLRPAMAAPLPWLAAAAGAIFGRRHKDVDVARRRLLKLPRSLSVTTEGKWYIGILLMVGIAAINTGNNLLYLVVAMMLSIIIVSGFLSESSLRSVRVKRELPRHIYKGQPAMARLKLSNRKSWFPSFSIFSAELPVEGVASERTYTLKLRPGAEAAKATRYTFTRRGVVVLPGVKLTTRFPFSIFVKGKVEEVADRVVVYPSVDAKVRHQVSGTGGINGQESTRFKGTGGALYGLREYTLTDDARFIHWRSAARSQRLYYTEQEQEAERAVAIVFDNYSTGDPADFENAVDEAATLAYRYIQLGFRVALKTLDGEVGAGRGSRTLNTILHSLALITPKKDAAGRAGVRVKPL